MLRAGAIALALSLTAAACGDDGEQSADPGSDTTQVGSGSSAGDGCTADRIGGSVTMGTVNPTTVLDPPFSLGTGATGGIEVAALYDTLFRYDPSTEDYEPHMAESVEPNDDNTVWTLKLREGVEFSNGDPLDADAVIASLERWEGSTVQKADLVNMIESMEAPDPLTVVFTLSEPFGAFPFLLSTEPGMIVNPNVVDPDSEDPLAPQPGMGVGAGPYDVARFVPDEELVLTANENYWGGPVCIEELRFVQIPGGRGTYDAFKAGELQIAIFDDPEVVAEAKADGVDYLTSALGLRRMLAINMTDEAVTSDIRIRQALAHAIDYETLNARLAPGTELAGSAMVMPSSPLFDGVEGLEFDLDKARGLVEEAKADGWDGKLELITADEPFLIETTILLEGMLEAAGMDITVDSMPLSAQAPRVIGLDYELAMWGAWVAEPSPWSAISSFASDSARSRTGYQNPEMDVLLDELQAARTLDEIREVMGRIQGHWNENIPSLPVFHGEFFFPLDPALKGVTQNAEAVVMFYDAYMES